jgi:hypothetical protein
LNGLLRSVKLEALEKPMKPPPGNENEVLDKLSESVRSHGDSKSIFGLLLRIERELRAESLDNGSTVALPEGRWVHGPRRPTIFRTYIE